MKVLTFGSMNIDYVYSVPHIILPGETLSSTERNIFIGGKGLNQSVAMARAGLEVWHAGKIGTDGGVLLEALKADGVNVSLIKTEDALSGHTIIQVDEAGQNSIILFKGTNYMMTSDYIDDVLSFFSEGDTIVLQNEINLLDEVIDKAFEKRIRIVLNPSPFEKKLLDYNLEKVSMFIINEVEGEQISGVSAENPEGILTWFEKNYPSSEVILTLGPAGAWYSFEGERIFQEAEKVKAVDTTSAGDTFSGYYLAGRADGMSVKNALTLAARASAITVSRPGASPSIPRREELS